MKDKKQQLELDLGEWTSSKLGKEYVKAVYCHPAYLTYMKSTSCEMRFVALSSDVTLMIIRTMIIIVTMYVKAVYCHPAYLTYMQNSS